MDPLYKIRLAEPEDAEPIRAIRNDVIEHETSMWTTHLISPEQGRAWLADNMRRGSIFVATRADEVAGFTSWSPWREKDGYRYTVEDSVYLTAGHQGRGLGTRLLQTLIDAATRSGAHVMVASIEASNTTSIALHAGRGFEVVGTAREVGTKFGRWLDLTIMRRPLGNSPGPVVG